MKKLYLLIMLLFFALQHTNAQLTTETFESISPGASTFTNGTKFNLTGINGFNVFEATGAGYNGSNRFIQVNDDSSNTYNGQTGTIKSENAVFKINSLWIFLTGNNAFTPNVTFDGLAGSVTFTGKLAGVTKFVLTKNNNGTDIGSGLPNKGFSSVNFASDGGSDLTNILIDQLDITLSSNYDYFAIDNFTFTKIVAPTFISHPTSKTICPSVNTSFSISASNATSYQWQVNTGGGFTDLSNSAPYSNVTSSTLNITGVTSSMNGYQYRCVATGSGSTNSNAATLTVPNVITSSVPNQTGTSAYGLSDGSATISASGGTSPYFYSWSPSGGTNAMATNLAAGTYTVTITDSTPNGLGGCSATQDVIITQPAGATVSQTSLSGFSTCAGSASFPSQSFTVNAGGLTANLSLSAPTGFQISADAGGNGTYSTNLDIIPSSGIVNRTIYVRLVANATGTPSGDITVSSTGIPSKTIALTGTVNPAPAITAQPSSILICPGDNATFSVNASNATGYQWQVDDGNGFVSVPNGAPYSGQTTATLTITGATAALNGYLYRAVAIGSCSPSAISNNAALSISSAPSITTQPSVAPVTLCTGNTATISVTASNATGYQWYIDQGSGFNPISDNAMYSGATTSTLNIAGVTIGLSGYLYRVVASGNCTPTATSNNVALIVNSFPSITSQPSAKTICPGENTTFSVSASYATGYQWQVEKGQGFENISDDSTYSGATTATLTISGATAELNGYLYRAVVSGICTPLAVSNNAALTIKPTPSITSDPTSVAICSGGNATFSVTASNATAYKWQLDQGQGLGFADVPSGSFYSGFDTSTLVINGAPATFNGYKFRVIATGSCTPAATSNIATLSVDLISILTSKTDVACFGSATGIATATATGGVGDYTYSWSNGKTTATITDLIAGTYTVTVNDEAGCSKTASVTIGQPSSAITLTDGTVTNVSCNGGANGTAEVIATGGASGFTYSWNTIPEQTTATATGLSAGTYTVTVTDANACKMTRDFTIGQPTALSALTGGSHTDVSCNGGSNGTATVEPTGGTPIYTYSWNTNPVQITQTATNLAEGTYTVTVTDANACQVTRSFTIGQPAILSASKSSTDVLCYGTSTGSATVTATGGTGTYTYIWSPSGGTAATATGLATGNYSCLITDANGCSITETFFIDEPTTLDAVPSQINATCSVGGQASVSASGGVGSYSYLWTPGGASTATITNLAAGNYSCVVTDGNGCTVTRNFTITTTNTLVAINAQQDVKCNGAHTGSASVIPSGAPGPFTYAWSPSGGNSDTATNLAAGNYSVTITAGNGCSIVKNFTITEPSPIVITKTGQTDVTCPTGSNGSLSVNVTGGAGSYTYSWAPSGGTAATATGLAAGDYTLTVGDANGCIKMETYTITQPDALTPSISKTDVSCNNGSNGFATVSVTGGTGAYTYSWSPSGGTAATASGLSAGNYIVTIKDANLCETTASVLIEEPALLTATIEKTDVLCNQANNGTATVTATGGTGNYTYLWSPSGGTAATATGLSPNTYTVQITDENGCFIIKTIEITEPTALSTIDSHVNVTCNGGNNGTASVVTTGGTGNYSYLWAPSGGTAATATGLKAGTYTVTVTDENSCSTVNTIVISEPDALTLTATSVDVSCHNENNGSASVTATGGTGAYTYSWSPSGGTAATATGLTAGVYTVTVTDANSCSETNTITITEPDALTLTATSIDVSCHNGNNGSASVTATGGTGAYTYFWSPSGGTAATATGLTAGTYTVTVTDANSCTATNTFVITEPDALTLTATSVDVSCHNGNNGSATVSVTGGTGAYAYSWSPSGGTAATATGLTAGTYTVTVTDANSCSETNTITITEPDALTLTTTSVNVSCHNGNNGSATVNATGGTGSYSYSWLPTGGTEATATNLTAGTYTVTVTDANSCSETNTIVISEPDALTLTATSLDVSCHNGNNGSASITVTGGTGAYTYSWSPSGGTAATATGLTAGIYTVIVTDSNSCVITTTIEIAQPENPVNLSTSDVTQITTTGASLSGTASSDGINTDKGECLTEVGFVYALHANPTTADTKINVTAALGTFTNALSGLRGNRTYYVRTYAVNSNGYINYGNEVSFTTQKYTLSIAAKAGLSKVYGKTDPVFNYTPLGFVNGDTSAIITGLLSRDAGEDVGKYNITLGSISAGTDYIIDFTGAEFEIIKADQTITWNQTLELGCSDSNTLTLTATTDSGLPVSYTIANTALGTISGTTLTTTGSGSTTITALQNGDQNHNAATAVIKPLEISQSGIVVQQWANVLFFDNKSNNFVAWQWYKNGAAVSGATRQYYSEVLPLNGTYYVIAKDKNGNSIKSCPIETTGSVFSKKIKIYPNPVKPGAEFTLECDFSESQLNGSEVVIFDITGKLIQTISNVKAKNQIIAPSQVALYVVVLKLADGQLKTINLLVK